MIQKSNKVFLLVGYFYRELEKIMQNQLLSSKPGKYHVGFHQDPLMASWLLLANFTILVAVMKWYKYSFYLHAILGFTIIGLTLAGTLHVLFEVGISYNPTRRFQTIHNVGGLIVVIWLSIQLITGILSRTIQYSGKTSPNFCKWTKRIHQYSSYLVMILGKFQYLIINYRRSKWLDIAGYLAIDAVFLMLYLWLKYGYWKMQQTVKDVQIIKIGNEDQMNTISNVFEEFWLEFKTTIKQMKHFYEQKTLEVPAVKYLALIYSSQKQIPISSYVLFNDYVYDISELNEVHPGGQKIIQNVKNRQVDRFLYGFYPLETNQKVLLHKHSKDSLKICGQPIARIQRSSPIDGFNAQLMKVKLSVCNKINQKSQIFCIHLRPSVLESQNWTRFTYKGYSQQSSLGQYFSLTISDEKGKSRITRLYTSVWSMRPNNLEFMKRNFPLIFPQMKIQITQSDIYPETEIKIQNEEVVPLMIKKYQKGQLTSRLLGGDYCNDILLSKTMGSGLRFDQLQEDEKVVIICGGTGLFPFCDLIDLLFKRVKYLENTNLSQWLKINDPIIQKDLVKNRQFLIYYACDSIEDTPTLTLGQLNYLSKSKFIQFDVFMRVKNIESQTKSLYPNINFQSHYFTQQVQKLCQQKHQLNKIFICGPHRMNHQVSKILIKNKINEKYWLFV